MSCAIMLPGMVGGKSEEESSNLSDKSYCVDALLSFEGDGDADGKNKDLHRSHDSEVTALVSNTAAAAAAKEAGAKQSEEKETSLIGSIGKGSESALAELASLLEHAASLESVTRKRAVRSNSFDSKRAPSFYTSSERTSSMYSSAPNLDFFNAFDQDPHLSDTEATEHRGSWWDDSEHTGKISAGFSKDFNKMHSTFSSRKAKGFSVTSTAARHCDIQESRKKFEMKALESPPPEHQDFWLDETESSERLSHSLHSIRKMEDQQRVKSDGTVKTDFTDMAVATSSDLLSVLSRNPAPRESESDTVATSPVTPTVTSRDSAFSSISNIPDCTEFAMTSPLRTKKVALRPKSPGKSPKRPSNTTKQIGGNELQTPIVSNKKKKVIKVRAGELSGSGEVDPSKVQEAVKKWKAAKHQCVSTATVDTMRAMERTAAGRASSSPPSRRVENVGASSTSEQPSGDASSRSRRSRTTGDSGDRGQREGRADRTNHAEVSQRSSSKGRTKKREGSSAQSDRHRSKSSSPPEEASRRDERSSIAEVARPRSHSRSKAPQATERPPEAPSTPSNNQKRLIRKTISSDASGVFQQPTSDPPGAATASAGSVRGRSRPNDPGSPMKTLRSLSIGRGNRASLRNATAGGSTRSSFTAVPDGEAARARSRSLGRIGSALFRRNHQEKSVTSSETRDPKAASGAGLFASLTNAVSRSSGTHGRAEAKLKASAGSSRSKSLPRMRQQEEQRLRGTGPEGSPPASTPPVATSKSPRRSLNYVSTRAICADAPVGVRGPAAAAAPSSSPSWPRRHRPIPPQDYIPESIELSPSSSAANVASRSSSMDNNEHSVIGAASSSSLAGIDRRQLLERTVSDLSDDAMFRRIQSAGVTEEMMSKLREVGLIITEAPPPAAKSAHGARRLSGSSRPM